MAPNEPAKPDTPFEAWEEASPYLFQSAPMGLILFDSNGRILVVNNSAVDLFGYRRDELIRENIQILFPERVANRHFLHAFQLNAHLKDGESGSVELLGRRKDGSEFTAEISFRPVRLERSYHILTAVEDVSTRREIAMEKTALAVEMETEKERHRIGMDLHDGIMQDVYAIGLALELALADFDEDREVARHSVEGAIDQLHGVIRNIRSYIFDLRPRQLSGNFSQALIDLAREFQQNSSIEARVELPDALPELPDETAAALYHIVHEALSNVQKHSKAITAIVSATVDRGCLHLTVTDDGDGFDASNERPQRHRGVRNMQTRARAIDAELTIDSAAGRGTAVIVELPLDPRAGSRPLRDIA